MGYIIFPVSHPPVDVQPIGIVLHSFRLGPGISEVMVNPIAIQRITGIERVFLQAL
jgi:hypothetical protein